MKVDPSKDGKENVLVMTDAFSKFSVAVVMPNQLAKTVAKAPGRQVVLCLWNTNKNP